MTVQYNMYIYLFNSCCLYNFRSVPLKPYFNETILLKLIFHRRLNRLLHEIEVVVISHYKTWCFQDLRFVTR